MRLATGTYVHFMRMQLSACVYALTSTSIIADGLVTRLSTIVSGLINLMPVPL
jgi:hypothetical protein